MKTWFVAQVPPKKRSRRLVMAKLAIVLLTICLSLMLFKAWKLSSTNNDVINKVDIRADKSAMLGIMHPSLVISSDALEDELMPRHANAAGSDNKLNLYDSLQAIRMHNTLRAFTKRSTTIQSNLSLEHKKNALTPIKQSEYRFTEVDNKSQYILETGAW